MLERICWVVLASVHLAPAVALVRPGLLNRLYGVPPAGDVSLLLQHRAALFGVLVIACVWAAFDPGVSRLATVATALSMLGFLALWTGAGGPDTLRPIALADMIGLPALAYVAWRAFW